MGSDRAAAAGGAPAEGRATVGVEPGSAHGHSVRTPHGHSVGDGAAGTGRREWDDRLAPAARLAASGGMAPAAPGAAQPLGRTGPDQWVARKPGPRDGPGQKGSEASRRHPMDRGKPGTKHPVVVDAHGIPLAMWPSDKAYDAQRGREDLRRRGIAGRITHQGIEASERLGRYRWGGERTLAWRNQVRRLPVRYARRATIHQAFRDLGCALIGWNLLQAVFC